MPARTHHRMPLMKAEAAHTDATGPWPDRNREDRAIAFSVWAPAAFGVSARAEVSRSD